MDTKRTECTASTSGKPHGAEAKGKSSRAKKTSQSNSKFVGKISFGVQRAVELVGQAIKSTKSTKVSKKAAKPADVSHDAAGDAGDNREEQFTDGRQYNAKARERRRRNIRQERRYLPRLEGKVSNPQELAVTDEEGSVFPNFCHLSEKHADNTMKQIFSKFPLGGLPAPPIISGEKLTYSMDKDGVFEFLGSGSYGHVVKGMFDGHQVAIKLFKKRNAKLLEILNEACISVHLNPTQCTAHCFGLAVIKRSPGYHNIAIVMKYIGCEDGTPLTLLNFTDRYIADPKDPLFKGIKKKAWFQLYLEICEAVQKCHDLEVLISDIKLDNIMVYKQNGVWHPVLIDFGFGQYKTTKPKQDFSKESDEVREKLLEKYKNIAPEYIHNGLVGKTTDVYAIGALIQDVAANLLGTAKLDKIIAHCKNIDHTQRNLQYVIRKIKGVVKAERK